MLSAVSHLPPMYVHACTRGIQHEDRMSKLGFCEAHRNCMRYTARLRTWTAVRALIVRTRAGSSSLSQACSRAALPILRRAQSPWALGQCSRTLHPGCHLTTQPTLL